MTGERLSFKFQNNTLDNGLYLLDFQCMVRVTPGRNKSKKLNITGDRLSLKFQNSTAGETITLEDMLVYQRILQR